MLSISLDEPSSHSLPVTSLSIKGPEAEIMVQAGTSAGNSLATTFMVGHPLGRLSSRFGSCYAAAANGHSEGMSGLTCGPQAAAMNDRAPAVRAHFGILHVRSSHGRR